ncbi:glutathione peroxidase [Actinomycetes bacterium NPDC127524]
MSIYEFEAEKINGEQLSMKEYEGNVLLIVNTASKCGFTPQYGELEELYKRHGDDRFSVLGFPCNQFLAQEPGDNLEIDSFCRLNYGVTFPMFSKVDVNGKNAHPLFKYLTDHAPGVMGSKAIKWNFTKFLIDRDGSIVKRYSPSTKPMEIENDIQKLLKNEK